MSDRKLEVSIELPVQADAIWKALTEGDELRRWFPPDARVTPGEGGSIWVSWGEGLDWESKIEIWKPNQHLRATSEAPGPKPVKIVVDYFIEAKGATTVLRIVHSGFASADWEDELASTDAGWTSFLANLELYLTRHPGTDRTIVLARTSVPVSREEAFRTTVSRLGFNADALPQPGSRYDVTTKSGDRFRGIVKVARAPMTLSATIENLDHGFLMVEMERQPEGSRAGIWVSLYGDARSQKETLQKRLQELMP